MLRPIESNLSVYNVDQKASQVRDPNAHQFQAMQQDEINKKSLQEAQTVQKTDKTEGEVKVRERQDDRNKEEQRRRKRENSRSGAEMEEESAATSISSASEGGRLNFLA
ncbi:MAG: hypothetical protein LBQ58_08195 [Synergistaceae bacterium]|jgi:hypothetical protein|nr:hypothetical protein [Synergistaceae bacterium]